MFCLMIELESSGYRFLILGVKIIKKNILEIDDQMMIIMIYCTRIWYEADIICIAEPVSHY